MGRMLEAIAHQRGHTIISIIDPKEGSHRTIDEHSMQDVDVCLEFTHPHSTVDNIYACTALKKKVVVGTTGWFEKIPTVKSHVENTNNALLYAPNFAIGFLLYKHIAAVAAKLMNHFSQYDVAIVEEHHNQKADRPSGTAQSLAKLLQAEMERFRSKTPEIVSIRCGSIPGTHELIFDSPNDTLRLSHTARSRDGMAEGALIAAEWLHDKTGFFTLEDMLSAKLEQI